MIYSLHGELIHTEPNLAVVECGGVGYACRTTMNTLKKIGSSGEVKLFTQLNVREDAIDLFGFADTAELQAFRQLTSISGVGPKAALAILSDLTPSKLALCITTGDSKTLTVEVPKKDEYVVLDHSVAAEPLAVVVTFSEPLKQSQNLKDLIRFALNYLPPYKIPKSIELVDHIPVNENGKVVRSKLVEESLAKGY